MITKLFSQLIRTGQALRKENGDIHLLQSSNLFDENWYLANNPDVANAKVDPATHYLRYGGVEGRDPSLNFSSKWYLDAYDDVKKAKMNPLVHYLKYGRVEGRIAQHQHIVSTGMRNLTLNFNLDKKDLIDYAYSRCNPVPSSFADLGGVWNVDGEYTFYALREHKVLRAFLVDTDLTDATIQKSKSEANLTLICGNFGEESVTEQIGKVDAIFLFDVLLHQVKPDWNDVIEKYSERTNYFIIYNQQWIGSDQTVRLLDLGRDEYFKNTPHSEEHPTYRALFDKMYEIHPQHKRIWRDIHNVWQWGITDHDLIQTMNKVGYKMQYYKNCGRFFTLPNFENHAFVFQKM